MKQGQRYDALCQSFTYEEKTGWSVALLRAGDVEVHVNVERRLELVEGRRYAMSIHERGQGDPPACGILLESEGDFQTGDGSFYRVLSAPSCTGETPADCELATVGVTSTERTTMEPGREYVLVIKETTMKKREKISARTHDLYTDGSGGSNVTLSSCEDDPTPATITVSVGRVLELEDWEHYEMVFVPYEDKDKLDRELGQIAFEAYSKNAGGKTHDGCDIPPFDALGESVQSSWMASARAIREALEGCDD